MTNDEFLGIKNAIDKAADRVIKELTVVFQQRIDRLKEEQLDRLKEEQLDRWSLRDLRPRGTPR
jgi:hypothetical protein